MRRAAALLIATSLALPGPAAAQGADGETLADIRQDLTVLNVEIQRLKRQLSTTGGADSPPAGGSVLERVDLIEQALQRLTARTEELEFRIERIVEDGTNRIGDLAFRLCELEAECDIAELGDTPPLGGIPPEGGAAPPPDPAPGNAGPQLAIGEQADFDRARAALEAGENQEAARLFAKHVETYPGGPLSHEAQYLRGEALSGLGRTADAARAYLEAFSQAPDAKTAPDALLKLGRRLATLQQTRDACVTLGEVQARFPESDAAVEADAERSRLGCG